MLEKELDRLGRLTTALETGQAAARPAEGGGRAGTLRYGRRPDFTKAAVSGTRPNSGQGVTFHFKHSFISKRNSVSSGYRDMTSAPAHQRYIERAGAAEMRDSGQGEPGTHALLSFGNIDGNKEDRVEFWRLVERVEGVTGRVQCRMIVELPHEIDAGSREKIARGFCSILEDHGFPYWCVVHAPDTHNDRRNYHMHIAYYDRPAARLEDGQWDFAAKELVRWNNGQKREGYPHRQPKNRSAQGAAWIKKLRHHFAETANDTLADAGVAKRYDARSYRESGVGKMPTRHLGNKLALAEAQGLDTAIGAINTRREIAFRLDRPAQIYARAALAINTLIERIAPGTAHGATPESATGIIRGQAGARGEISGGSGARPAQNGAPGRSATHATSAPQANAAEGPDAGLPGLDQAARPLVLNALADMRRLLSRGLHLARRREIHLIAAELAGRRLSIRARFLDKEVERLLNDPPGWLGPARALEVAFALTEERGLISDSQVASAPFVARCRLVAQGADRSLDHLDRDRHATLKRVFALLTGNAKRPAKAPRKAGEASLPKELQLLLDEAGLALSMTPVSGPVMVRPAEPGAGDSRETRGPADHADTMRDPSDLDKTHDLLGRGTPGQPAPSKDGRAAPIKSGTASASGSIEMESEEIYMPPTRPVRPRGDGAPDRQARTAGSDRRILQTDANGELTDAPAPQDAANAGASGARPAGSRPAGSDGPRQEAPDGSDPRQVIIPLAEHSGATGPGDLAGITAPMAPDAPGAIAAPAGTTEIPAEIEPGSGRGITVEGALTVEEDETPELSRQLAEMANWQLRYHGFATRDAIEFGEDEVRAEAHGRAIEAIEREARRRGLDLETGKLDPAKAEDAGAARRHGELSQDLPDQMVRWRT